MKARKSHPSGAKRPIHVFFDQITQRFVAAAHYRAAGNGQVAVYGPKYDVTADVKFILDTYDPFGLKPKQEAETHEIEAASP